MIFLGFKKSIFAGYSSFHSNYKTAHLNNNNQAHTSRAMLFFRHLSPLLLLTAIPCLYLLTALCSFFKTLVDHEVTVELKNDISIKGVLKSVDQFLNIKLDDVQVVEELKYPHLVSLMLLLCRLRPRVEALRSVHL